MVASVVICTKQVDDATVAIFGSDTFIKITSMFWYFYGVKVLQYKSA